MVAFRMSGRGERERPGNTTNVVSQTFNLIATRPYRESWRLVPWSYQVPQVNRRRRRPNLRTSQGPTGL